MIITTIHNNKLFIKFDSLVKNGIIYINDNKDFKSDHHIENSDFEVMDLSANNVGYDFHGVDKPKNENSHYGLRYTEFVVPLVKATQEQQEVIENLEKGNIALEEQIKMQNSQMIDVLKRIQKLEYK